MKKLMIAAAVAACATVGMADEIASANIVGYTTIDAPTSDTYTALTVVFDNVGSDATVAITNLVTVGIPKGAASADVTTSDQIWRWNVDGTWKKYYYRQIGKKAAVGWCENGQDTVTTDRIPCGETFFFHRGKAGADTTLTLSGQVKAFTAEVKTEGIVADTYRFIGYPWPVDMAIGGFEKYQAHPKGAASADVTTSDQIWRWNANGSWKKYYYCQIGKKTAVGWCENGQDTVTSDVIPAGEGFFFHRGKGATELETITFTKD